MPRQLTFENETHWKISDVQRIVRLAMAEGGADPTEPRVVRVLYTTKKRFSQPSIAHVAFTSGEVRVAAGNRKGEEVATEILIYLPRRGARDPHPVAMVALAANSAVAGEVKEDDTLLPFSDVYYIANNLAYNFAEEAVSFYEDPDGKLFQKACELHKFELDLNAPTWVDASKLYIGKLKDPLKDATFQDFVRKKEAVVKREATIIAREEGKIASATRRMKDAKKRKSTAEKAIKDAIMRRKAGS